jgi:hypothetical protein
MPSCSFHAYQGDGPCPWCSEAAGVIDLGVYKPPVGACKFCESVEMRTNNVASPPYRWCGACGRRASEETRP